MKLRISWWILLLSTLLISSGCSTVSEGFVLREWKRNMAEFGIYPKFPLDEDVKVGDVLAVAQPSRPPGNDVLAATEGPLTFGYLVGSLSTHTNVATYYADRYGYEASPRLALSSTNTVGYGTTAATLTAKAFPQEMRRVGFPQFFRVKATGAQVGALVPIGQIAAKLGIDARDVESADVSVEDAGSTALPMAQVMSQLLDHQGKLNHTALGFKSAEVAKASLPVQSSGPNAGKIELYVINQVYYARSFDISLAVSSAARAGLENPGSRAGGSATSNTSSPQQAYSATTSLSTDGTKQGAMDYVDSSLKAGVTSLLPASGYTVAASQAQSGTIGLTQIYDRYLAIGYRGTKVLIDPLTLTIAGVESPKTDNRTAISAPPPKMEDERRPEVK